MSKRKALRVSNCWVSSSLSNLTSKMDFLLNVAFWALLLVHVDSSLGAPTESTVHVSFTPSTSTTSTSTTSTSTTSTSTTSTSTTSTGTNSTGTTSSSTASTSGATTTGATTTHSSVAPTAVHLDPSRSLSSTQSPGTSTQSTSTTDSARTDLNLNTTAASHHTQPITSTTADLYDGIKPTGDSSTQQHREPSSTAHPDTPTTTSRAAHPAPTATPLGTSSAPANARADTPSQLSMGGGATVVHETAAVDPLLAGLVSAFIITAVIITLLLFLKLRRRDNRPEFHRLQDLPMDDMMEDTPLSMYSY